MVQPADKYPSAARIELRSNLSLLIWLCALGAFILAWRGLAAMGTWGGQALLLGAVSLVALAGGIYRLRPWSRWLAIVFGALNVLGALGGLYQTFASELGSGEFWWRILVGSVQVLFWGCVAITFALPSTRARFELANTAYHPRARRESRAARPG